MIQMQQMQRALQSQPDDSFLAIIHLILNLGFLVFQLHAASLQDDVAQALVPCIICIMLTWLANFYKRNEERIKRVRFWLPVAGIVWTMLSMLYIQSNATRESILTRSWALVLGMLYFVANAIVLRAERPVELHTTAVRSTPSSRGIVRTSTSEPLRAIDEKNSYALSDNLGGSHMTRSRVSSISSSEQQGQTSGIRNRRTLEQGRRRPRSILMDR